MTVDLKFNEVRHLRTELAALQKKMLELENQLEESIEHEKQIKNTLEKKLAECTDQKTIIKSLTWRIRELENDQIINELHQLAKSNDRNN